MKSEMYNLNRPGLRKLPLWSPKAVSATSTECWLVDANVVFEVPHLQSFRRTFAKSAKVLADEITLKKVPCTGLDVVDWYMERLRQSIWMILVSC